IGIEPISLGPQPSALAVELRPPRKDLAPAKGLEPLSPHFGEVRSAEVELHRRWSGEEDSNLRSRGSGPRAFDQTRLSPDWHPREDSNPDRPVNSRTPYQLGDK